MSILFQDGFESGDASAWTSTASSGVGSTVAADATSKYAGSYGLHLTKPTGGNNGYARVIKVITPSGTGITSLQFRFRVVAVSGAGDMTFASLYYNQSPLWNRIAALVISNSQWQLFLRKKDGTTQTANVSFSTGTWYLVEIIYDTSGANPVASIYIDNALAATITDNTSGTVYTPDEARLDTHETSWTITGEAHYDDVSVADVEQINSPAVAVDYAKFPKPKLRRQ